jgi:hypothetical protein
MSNWRDEILAHFTPEIARLTLVADPDSLLLEESILDAIRRRGFDLIQFEDPVAFRFAYESEYRQLWDKGEKTELVVALRAEEDNLRALPFDLLEAGRKLPCFRLAHIFPKLSNPVIQALDRTLLDRLYDAYHDYDGGELGDQTTRSFILRRVFGLDPELTKTPAALMRLLCEKHSQDLRLPTILDEYLAQKLRANPAFRDWPLEKIVPSRSLFLRLLQEHWPAFLNALAPSEGASTQAHLQPGFKTLQTAGLEIPFEEVRAYIESFFINGDLVAVPHGHPERLPDWVKVGVAADPLASSQRRFALLMERVEKEFRAAGKTYTGWHQFAWQWAELLILRSEIGAALDTTTGDRLQTLHESVERTFSDWMLEHFGSLANLVERDGGPVMLHHIARYLAMRYHAGERRLALIVVDGLAIDQWLLIREALTRMLPSSHMEERTAFAWIPTLTSVSRQAIFAGEKPLFFGESIATTRKEESHWRRVWENAGAPPPSIGFRAGLSHEPVTEVMDLMDNPRIDVLGLVINTVDDLMHGSVLGTAGMHQNVKLWADGGALARLIGALQERGFVVYLTADHGNVEAVGQGRPNEGVLVEMRGARARVYESDLFRSQVRQQFPETIMWPDLGLPVNTKVLLADGRTAFASEAERIVAHGGIALEEVLVPFIRFSQE